MNPNKHCSHETTTPYPDHRLGHTLPDGSRPVLQRELRHPYRCAEGYYREQVDDVLKHYTAAEVATAGIFAAKFLEHKALSDLGIWNSRTENYYYRRIYRMVAEKIMPKIWVVAKQMLHSPQTAIYWGSYLMKVCDDTKSLCMQFESVVTNSTLTFSDIAFLEINPEIAPC